MADVDLGHARKLLGADAMVFTSDTQNFSNRFHIEELFYTGTGRTAVVKKIGGVFDQEFAGFGSVASRNDTVLFELVEDTSGAGVAY